jgi:hypothetical protein
LTKLFFLSPALACGLFEAARFLPPSPQVFLLLVVFVFLQLFAGRLEPALFFLFGPLMARSFDGGIPERLRGSVTADGAKVPGARDILGARPTLPDDGPSRLEGQQRAASRDTQGHETDGQRDARDR